MYRGKSQKKNPPWDLKSCCRKGERCWRDAYSRRLNRRLQQEPEAGKPGMNTSLVCDVWSTNICTTQLLPAFNSSCSDLGTFRRSELWARTAGFQWELSEEGELTKGHSVYLFHVTVLFFVCLFYTLGLFCLLQLEMFSHFVMDWSNFFPFSSDTAALGIGWPRALIWCVC